MDFDGDWYGWRLRGAYLVSPDGQRLTRERLDGLLWRDELELRRAGFVSRRAAEAGHGGKVKVVIIDASEWHLHGTRAG